MAGSAAGGRGGCPEHRVLIPVTSRRGCWKRRQCPEIPSTKSERTHAVQDILALDRVADPRRVRVRREVEAALQELSAASSSYARQARATPKAQHAADSALQQTIAQLRAQLLAIEPDVEELEDAIAAIEEPGVARRLGISDSEVKSRRSVVQRIKGDLEVRNPLVLLPSLWALRVLDS